jgi:UDP-4-amino-4,6-dideoxy-N-acetyl-beta-L-altrosamine transaminase
MTMQKVRQIPYGRQDVTDSDVQAVISALRSDFLTQGPIVPEFEAAIASRVGAKHAIAVNNATSALHLACLALGVGRGDTVWTSPITFVASANCARYCGAEADFVDIDPKSYNMSPERLHEKLVEAERDGQLPKVVIPVHLAGSSADMQAIYALGQRYGFRIIEDASHAIGGEYRGLPIGGCQHSDIAIFSFHPVKIITTGEGGVASTNDAGIARQMRRLRSHGITRDREEMGHDPDGSWYYEQLELGFNYRMTEVQAALGLSQLSRLDQYVKRRNEIAREYDRLLEGLPVKLPWRDPRDRSSFHLYIIRLDRGRCPVSHREAFDRMRSRGVLVNLHYIPVYRQPDYRRSKDEWRRFPEAENYYAEAMSLPMFPAMTEEDQVQVVDALTASLRE